MRRSMMWYFILCTLVIDLYSQQYHADYTAEISQAYDAIMRMNFDEAAVILDRYQELDRSNVAIHHMYHYIDFYTGMTRTDHDHVSEMGSRLDRRLEHVSGLATESPYRSWIMAEMYLQYALVQAKHGLELKAGWNINRAYKLLKKNRKSHPAFQLNDKSLSIIHTLVGSIRGLRRTMMQLFTSLEGSHAMGVDDIKRLYDHRYRDICAHFALEISVIRAMIALHVEKDESKAMSVILQDLDSISDYPMVSFIKASMLSQMNHHDEAMEVLESAISLGQGNQLPYLHQMLGVIYVDRHDQRGPRELHQFLNKTYDEDYIKEAYQKLAWSALVTADDSILYLSYMDSISIAGALRTGEDQYAQREADQRIIPDIQILRSQMYYDGGQYDRALSVLESAETYSSDHQYRAARIYHAMDDTERAISLYREVISHPQSSDYELCNSALQLGSIHCRADAIEEAEYWLKRCLKYKPKVHKDGLHQKARSWIEIVKEKRRQ